jgi:D-arabinan exo alpha-(1,3)/(1,5)-arabinofuranosidase (non-reducing end)
VASVPYGDMLTGLTRVRDGRSARASSWDPSGRNQDYWVMPPGESVVLADLEGPGCITHIWMTQFCRRVLGPSLLNPERVGQTVPVLEIHNALGLNWEAPDPDYYRKVLIKIYWDDQAHPSVLAPLGDFFCIGHSMPGPCASIPFTVSSKPEERYTFGGTAALNCYLQMPFNKRARIEVENQNDVPYGQYFYIDYELYREPLGDDIVYLHAQWRRENPCGGWAPDLQTNSPEVNVANLDGKDNYAVLEAEGRGHYIGCNLSVTHFQGSWWGEGDDMIFIDGETWPPSLHGTGTEDYFGHAWGMQNVAYPMNGSIIHESVVPGYPVSYRFHLLDPVRFERSIRVTVEHGHANHLSDDWASTAYWYQTLPTTPFSILPVEQRLPLRPSMPGATAQAGGAELNEEMRAMRATRQERFDRYVEERDAVLARRIEDTRRRSELNREQARRIRRSFH